MGARLSRPSSPSGTEEAPRSLTTTSPTPKHSPPKRPLKSPRRFLLVPLAALTFGSLIFVYSRTTVAAAKENARRAREADGGSISWRREGMRRRGQLERVQERTLWGQLVGEEQDEKWRERAAQELRGDVNPIEEGIRRAREGRKKEKEKGEGVGEE